MIKINELSVTHSSEGLKSWSRIIKRELNFADAKISTPPETRDDLFSGHMVVEKMNDGTLYVRVDSSSQKTSLIHNDCMSGAKTKLIIINSCTSILIRDKHNREIISPGDSIIVPAWNSYVEESFSGRTSLSLIINVSSIADSVDALNGMLWKKVSSLHYGFEINKIISNYYINNNVSKFCEKNNTALIGLLGLEAENSLLKPDEKQFVNDNRFSVILNYIKNNIKNPKLNLSAMADYLAISERMVQYTLASKGVTFHQLLSSERCLFLANEIKFNRNIDVNISIFEAGFESIPTACRQFKNFYGVTPRQFQRKTEIQTPIELQ
ncbi:helix-turn-helix transcriptional regulator [Escherichia coli]|nr:helix-turn-helix transcriptional regulator [Escherichia coli]